MKLFRHIAMILVLAALAGCARMEVIPVPDREVSFAVGSYNHATRANSALQDIDGGVYSFNSKAYLYADGYMDSVQSFFGVDGETISAYDASGNAVTASGTTITSWAPSHPYFWPKSSNSYIDFVSWYDKNGAPASVEENEVVWTIDGSTRSLAADDKLMIADKAWHYNDNATVHTSVSGVTEGVPTLFHHLLSQVRVVVKASKLSDSGTTWTVSASDFVLGNVYTTGSLTLSNSEPAELPSTKPWTGSWTTSGTRSTIDGVSAETTVTTSGVDMLLTRSMIPQPVGSAYISFSYKVRTQYDADNYIEETVETGRLRLSTFTGAGFTWDMNKITTYTVTINPECNEILVDPETSDWTSLSAPALSIE